MASSAGFAITISAVDGASTKLDTINRRIAALKAPADRFTRSLQKFGDVSGVTRLAEGMKGLGDRTLGFARTIERAAGGMSAITGAASIGGIIELSRRWGAAGNAISNVSYALSLSPSRLSALQGGAKLAGASVEAMTTSLHGANEAIKDAQFHRADAATPLWSALHIAPVDKNGNPITPDQLLRQFADATKGWDPHRRQRAEGAFGIDAGLDPMLRNGSKGFDKFVSDAKATGGTLTDGMVDDAKKMNTAWNRLGESIEGVANRLTDKYAPAVTKTLDQASDWIANNKKQADSITEIGTAIMGLTLLKPAAWVMKLLGLGALTEVAVPLAAPLALGGDTNKDATPGGFRKGWVPDNKGESFGDTWLGRKWRSFTTPRGIRNNNPLNLSYAPGQGAVGSDGRFGRYRTMQEGIAASERQLLRYQDRDHLNTIAGIVAKWAPPGENDTGAYIQYVARRMNKAPNAPLDLHDQSTAASLIAAMARRESGAVDPKVIAQGVRLGLGQPANAFSPSQLADMRAGRPLAYDADPDNAPNAFSPAQLADIRAGRQVGPSGQPVQGAVKVDVHLHNAPPGTRATAVASGAASASPPRIETGMAYSQ